MSVSKDPNGLWCVILAAGASTRLGKPKQLVRYRSRPLLLHAAHAATSMSPNHTIVVLGAHSLRLRALIARHLESVSVVVNPRWQSGMTSSLITGLSALPSNARAALLVLSDQPRVGPQSLRRLVKAWRTKPSAPAAAYFSDTIGAPAILPRRYWVDIRKLRGDVGARSLLQQAGVNTTKVTMPEAALDVDTDEDLKRL
ncbi:MAG: nucleotidyltransferase family protein [Gammaproteobacteria bacterium]